MPGTVAPGVAQDVSRPLSNACNPVGVAFAARLLRHGGMESAMDAKQLASADLERELETWDWARAAGVSAEELRQALQAPLPVPELRKAA